MQPYFQKGLDVLTTIIVLALLSPQSLSAEQTSDAVRLMTLKVAHWQIDTFDEHAKYRGIGSKYGTPPPEKFLNNWPDLAWQNAALYVGLNEWRKFSRDEKVQAFLLDIGRRNQWRLWDRPYHADDHAVGQFYLSLYEEQKQIEMVEPTRSHFDWILNNPKVGSLYWKEGTDRKNRWGWCDALFMAPPVWARLARITGESKYLAFMHQEYQVTHSLLWSVDDHLFFRDTSFFTQYESNGRHIYWARGQWLGVWWARSHDSGPSRKLGASKFLYRFI